MMSNTVEELADQLVEGIRRGAIGPTGLIDLTMAEQRARSMTIGAAVSLIEAVSGHRPGVSDAASALDAVRAGIDAGHRRQQSIAGRSGRRSVRPLFGERSGYGMRPK